MFWIQDLFLLLEKLKHFEKCVQRLKHTKNGGLSICKIIWKMGLVHMLKHMKNRSLGVCSNLWKMGPWAYAQSCEKRVLEHMLKNMKNGSLSVCSVGAWWGIECEGWRWHSSHLFLILLFTKPNIEVNGWKYQPKTHITKVL